MQIFRNRPLALACWALALTAVGSGFLSFGTVLFLLVILSVLSLVALGITAAQSARNRTVYPKALPLLICSLGAVLALLGHLFWFQIRPAQIQITSEQNATVEGLVLERSYSAPYTTVFHVEIRSVNGEKDRFSARLEVPYASAMQSGDVFSATVRKREFSDAEEKSTCFADGQLAILVCSSAEECDLLEHSVRDWRVIWKQWNIRLSTRLFSAVGGEEGALVTALLLGNRSFLSADTVLWFRRCGISHLLALSGLHVSILCGLAEWLLRYVFRVPRTLRAVGIPAFLLFYLAVTGFAPSTIRAVCMVSVLYLSFLLRTEYDSFTALSATLAGILLITPYAVMDLSMWMSFLSASAIVIFLPPISTLGKKQLSKRSFPIRCGIRIGVGILTAVCVGISANLALMWLSATVFGEVSLLSFPTTLVLSLPMTALLAVSFFTLLFPQCAVFSQVAKKLGQGMLWVSNFGSDQSYAMLSLSKLDAVLLLLVMSLVLIALAVSEVKRKQLFLLPLLLSVAVCVGSFGQIRWSDEGVCMTYLPVSDGSVCLFSERGVAVAVDASNGHAEALTALEEALQRERCTELSDLFLTRYYNMEAAYLQRIATSVRVRCLHLPDPLRESEQAIAFRLEQEAALHGIQVIYGISETGLGSLQIENFSHAPSDGSSRPGILWTAYCEEKRICMINMSTRYSALSSEAQNRIASADILIVNRAGMTVQNSGSFEYRSEKALALFLESEDLKVFLPNPSERIQLHIPSDPDRIRLRGS